MSICPSCKVKPLKRDFKLCWDCKDKNKLETPKVYIPCKECDGKNKHEAKWPRCFECGNKTDLDVIMCKCNRQKHHSKFKECYLCSSEKDILMHEGIKDYENVIITMEEIEGKYHYKTNLCIVDPPELKGFYMIDNHLHFVSADLITKRIMDKIIAKFSLCPPNL